MDFGNLFPGYGLSVLMAIIGLLDVLVIEGSLDIYRLSRMNIATKWLLRSLIYGLLFTYAFLLDHRTSFHLEQFLRCWSILFMVVLAVKLSILTWSSHRLKSNRITYRALFIGLGDKAYPVLMQLLHQTPSLGQKFVGYLGELPWSAPLTCLGSVSNLPEIIKTYDIEEVTIALDPVHVRLLEELLRELRSAIKPLLIRLTPESYDFLMGRVKLDALYGTPLIELPSGILPLWQQTIKRGADLLVSILLLILLSPLILYIVIRIKLNSEGPVLYRQQRIGLFGHPFTIFKFRSMYQDAEPAGPQLSFDGDQRCTPWGATMRKWRLDEIPQFINVIKGEMSIVGPRPERNYFIDKIKIRAPYYTRILTVRPGITSWGQVKYGYASDLDQMIERLHFDLIYVENLSLQLDIKIILYTILVLFQGKGK